MVNKPELPNFADPAARDELYGFSERDYGNRLPGNSWESGNMFNMHEPPNCNNDAAVFNDTVWRWHQHDRLRLGEKPGDAVLQHIFYNDAVRRLQAVEQLTLPPEYSTIPNTAAFSRFEHIWGSVLFVRQVAEDNGISDELALGLELRTLLSDVAHTTGSHLGDWMFQGMGGAENQHDLELERYLEAVGIIDILAAHNIDPKSVVFPDKNDWVESRSPDLCVDRVDYALREMNRWNIAIRMQAYNSKDFTVTPEGMLAMVDQQRARAFSEGFLLLSQEHWSEPTHRFLLDMQMLRTKLFYAQGGAPRSWVFNPDLKGEALIPLHGIHPRDLMYVTDHAQIAALAQPSLGGYTLDAIMRSVSQYRRQYVWPGRNQRIFEYMSQFIGDDYEQVKRSGTYEPLESHKFDSYQGEYPATLPVGFSILNSAAAQSEPPEGSIDFKQPPLKTRQIDPLVRTTNGDFKRLSVLDPSYAQRLAKHKAAMGETRTVRLAIPDPATFKMLQDMITNVEHHWQERLKTSRRMEPAELRELVKTSSSEIHGQYPFLTFFEY